MPARRLPPRLTHLRPGQDRFAVVHLHPIHCIDFRFFQSLLMLRLRKHYGSVTKDMSDFEELLTALGPLLHKFGPSVCKFAMEVWKVHQGSSSSIAGNSTRSRGHPPTLILGSPADEPKFMEGLALLYCSESMKAFDCEVATEFITPELDVAMCLALGQRSTLLRNQQSALGRQPRGHLTLKYNSPVVVPMFLKNLDMFQGISIVGNVKLSIHKNKAPDEDSWLELTEALTQVFQGNGPSLLLFRRCFLSLPRLENILRLVHDGNIREFVLQNVELGDNTKGTAMIHQRFTKISNLSTQTLERFKVEAHSWSAAQLSQVIQPLGGIETLKRLHLVGGDLSSRVLQILSNDVLKHSSCYLEELLLKFTDRLYGECGNSGVEHFCGAVAQSKLRRLVIEIDVMDMLDIQRLVNMAVSPGIRIHHLELICGGIAEWTRNFGTILPINVVNGQQSEVNPSQLRHLILQDKTWSKRRFGSLAMLQHHLDFWLPLVRANRLPYLCNFGKYYGLAHVGREALPFDLDMDAQHQVKELKLWLARNKAGRACFLLPPAEQIPLGFWPVVLEQAAKRTTTTGQADLPAMEGLFYLVQELAKGSIIRSP